jgi:predicted nucleotidyltransferase/DNA-binding XRE family transcriptional regulator
MIQDMGPDAGALIREARSRAGLSQAELARRAKVAQPVISAYENGRREPGLTMLAKLVEASGNELSVEVLPSRRRLGLPDTTIGRRLRRHRRSILAAAQRRGVSNVRVFGSVARGEDDEASDVDLVVDLDDEVSLLALIGLEREIGAIVGREVDIVPARSLKPGMADAVLADSVEL